MSMGVDPGFPPVERQLDGLIDRLGPQADNPAARSLLIEARRLRSMMENWRTVPPAAHVREEMTGRVMHLSAAVADMLPPSSMAMMGRPSGISSMSMAAVTGIRLPAGLNNANPEETLITQGNDALPTTPLDVVPVKVSDDLSVHLAMLKDPYSRRADAYRALRHQISKRGDPKVIGVTSPGRREGKTTLAINLAASLREGARGRVLLVEANPRAPSVAATLGFMPPTCFLEQLRSHRREPLEPWTAAEIFPSLHAMAINPVNKQVPLLDPIAFSIAMDRLRYAGYDYIVVDTSPVLESADVNLISDSVDGFVLSAVSRRSDTKLFRKAVAQLGIATFLGAVLLE
jgi:Mrp family chromosome partitioning ATPase